MLPTMIRRQVAKEYWLIRQHDHALLAASLARMLGNQAFSPPSSEPAIWGIAWHDCGWNWHDDRPTLNCENIPADVFETPAAVALNVWERSARLAAEQDDYAGLLVSLHSLALSVFATLSSPINNARWNLGDLRVRFEVNRFQHAMVELQQTLRTRLGMRTDRPLKFGLAEGSDDPAEQRLEFDYRWLSAMDRLSLSICCDPPPFAELSPVLPRAGAVAVSIRLHRSDDGALLLDPWPFAVEQIRLQIPFRRLPARQWNNPAEFRQAYATATPEQFTATLGRYTIA